MKKMMIIIMVIAASTCMTEHPGFASEKNEIAYKCGVSFNVVIFTDQMYGLAEASLGSKAVDLMRCINKMESVTKKYTAKNIRPYMDYGNAAVFDVVKISQK